MPRLLPKAPTLLLICLGAICLTVLSSGYNKQPPNCEDTSPRCAREFCRGTCGFGEQTAGFPFRVLRDTFGSSPTGGFGKIDESDWVNGGLSSEGFFFKTLFYFAILLPIWYIGKQLKTQL